MDSNPVPIEFWHCDSLAACRKSFVQPYSSPIQVRMGIAHLRKRRPVLALGVGAKSIDNVMADLLTQRATSDLAILFPPVDFIFAFASGLERDHSCAQGRHRSGGCQTIRQCELPP
jgi:hypothetical protein